MDRCPECRTAMTTPDAEAKPRILTCPKCNLHVTEVSARDIRPLENGDSVYVSNAGGAMTFGLARKDGGSTVSGRRYYCIVPAGETDRAVASGPYSPNEFRTIEDAAESARRLMIDERWGDPTEAPGWDIIEVVETLTYVRTVKHPDAKG